MNPTITRNLNQKPLSRFLLEFTDDSLTPGQIKTWAYDAAHAAEKFWTGNAKFTLVSVRPTV